jgi:hypothetical protein
MRTKTIATLTSALVALALAVPAAALSAPELQIATSHAPKSAPVGTYAKYELVVSNTGTTETSENVTVDFSVPAGLEITNISSEEVEFFEEDTKLWNCSKALDSQSGSCTGPEITAFGIPMPIEAGKEACEEPFFGEFQFDCRVFVTVRAEEGAPTGLLHPTATVCGGGDTVCPAPADTAPDDPLLVVPFDFHLEAFDGRVLKENGDPATEAGSHPHTAETEFETTAALTAPNGFPRTVGQIKDVTVELPPGLVGNPLAIPTCTQAQLLTDGVGFQGNPTTQCPAESQVGIVKVIEPSGGVIVGTQGVFSMERPQGSAASRVGVPALFAFEVGGVPIQVYAKVRTGEDYGVTIINKNAAQTIPFNRAEFIFWGVPADPVHDPDRLCAGGLGSNGKPKEKGCESEGELVPFLSLPTSCEGPGPFNSVETSIEVLSWEGPSDTGSFLSHNNEGNPIGATGCNALDFSPTLEARPTTNVADAPSGLDFDLHIPQTEECLAGPPVTCTTAQAHLKDTTISLPEGLVVNPSGANGLDGCSLSEFGFTNKEGDVIHTTPNPATCPDASKLGTVEVDTPLLDHPLKGSVHIADPYANPFNSLLAIYITLDDPATGVIVKLAGQVKADPNTGQLTTTVLQNPQQPFEDFRIHFFGGAGGSLRTPAACGQYTTTSNLTPWSAPESGPPDEPTDTWAITQAPGGGACPTSTGALPHAPSFDAGTVSPIAKAFSPFVVHLRRADGSQNFQALGVSPPQGLIAKLAGTTQCPESALVTAASKSGQQEKASPSCPASSEVGSVVAGAGAGPAPYYAQGKAYLTGPYKGAPLSMAIVTPATAGPFDLGTIVVRTALYVDSKTAKINAVSDPIPSILQGIPLDVRTVDVALDRPEFTFNPTSCDPMSVDGSLTSTLGQIAPLSSRFQVGECGRLGFKPQMSLNLKGGTTRGKHPALTAVLTPREGDANIASLSVALPKSEFLDQAHIGTVCTRVQFAQDACPAASIYGEATVFTPVLDEPLTGHVYLRSSDNLLPDLVPDLRGPAHLPIRVESAGRTDSIKGGLRNTFDFVPDAPFTKLVVQLQGGKKGLLQNSRNICSQVYRATVKYTAHNGKTLTQRPPLKNSKCGKAKKRKAAKRAKRRAARAAR